MQQHQEFVAAQAYQAVLGAQRLVEEPRHLHQHLVATLVAMGVVDQFELVQIHHDATPAHGGVALVQLVQEAAVVAVGQRVGERPFQQLLFLPVLVGDVLGMCQHHRGVGFHVQHVVVLPMAQTAVAGHQFDHARILAIEHHPREVPPQGGVALGAHEFHQRAAFHLLDAAAERACGGRVDADQPAMHVVGADQAQAVLEHLAELALAGGQRIHRPMPVGHVLDRADQAFAPIHMFHRAGAVYP